MRLLIVDDHPLVTLPLRDQLGQRGHECAVAESVAEGVRAYAEGGPFDLCLLDLDLPDGSGAQLLGRTPGEHAAPPTVVLSGKSDNDEVMLAFDAGAVGFISKTCSFEGLIAAIDAALAARADLSADAPVVWDDDSRAFIAADKAIPRGVALSVREREVFRLLREGLPDKQIAHQLDRSIHTIRIQIRSIKRKRKNNRRAEMWR